MILTSMHYLYIVMVFIILAILLMKKDIVIPCIIGIFAIGYLYSGNIVFAIQTIYNTIIYAGNEFWGIIVIISLVVSMSKALQEIGADVLIMSPIKKLMVNSTWAFFSIGLTMMIISWLVWPSPAVALVGAVLLPAAVNAGLPVIWAAVAMNLFGHGLALSSDFFIQGAPAITAKAANIGVSELMKASLPLWLTMSVVTITVAFIMLRRDMKKEGFIENNSNYTPLSNDIKETTKLIKFISIVTPIAFVADILAMWKLNLRGGDATALVGGTAIIIMLLITLTNYKFNDALDKVVEYLKDGFGFGIKIFAPVIIIGGFFFLGNEGIAKNVLGENATGLLNDISIFISQNISMSKIPAIIAQSSVAIITGLDGSGFSGLPIVGSLAYTFSNVISISKEGLAALGQIITVWVGGGTIIPWAVIPVAAICGINAADLARKNFIPVLCGLGVTIIVAIIIL
ncbi:hypothetical protein J2Z76_002642 [Sedimentibacter acidaminivorans]|uniref:Transporter n=1 Tax=Sedimentibacter acidaminivorans TaxID=913099 RepID=A0ABS4GGW3_9FIRM|nr:hypothetical protein [Sedimentibacter acidaminivorans]MBP1926772.1 hypothetical protein [Sedimentibacter acidaminivorans]